MCVCARVCVCTEGADGAEQEEAYFTKATLGTCPSGALGLAAACICLEVQPWDVYNFPQITLDGKNNRVQVTPTMLKSMETYLTIFFTMTIFCQSPCPRNLSYSVKRKSPNGLCFLIPCFNFFFLRLLQQNTGWPNRNTPGSLENIAQSPL